MQGCAHEPTQTRGHQYQRSAALRPLKERRIARENGLVRKSLESDEVKLATKLPKLAKPAAKADLRLVGIGQMDQRAQVHVDGFVTREELLEMMRLGAVGELTGWAFDAQGNIIKGGTNARLTSIPPQVPAEALTIGAAVGPAKVSAIRAALKGRLVNGLITDEATASAILSSSQTITP